LVFKQPTATNIVQQEWVLAVELRPGSGRKFASGRQKIPPADRNFGSTPDGAEAFCRKAPFKDFLNVGLGQSYAASSGRGGIAGGQCSLHRSHAEPHARRHIGNTAIPKGFLVGIPWRLHGQHESLNGKKWAWSLASRIFHSGRNYFNFRSAAAQKTVAQENVRKVRGEITFEITRAYYNLIRSQRAVKARRELSQRSDKVIELGAEEETVGVDYPLGLFGGRLAVQPRELPAPFRRKDLEIARLKMAGFLNITENASGDPHRPRGRGERSKPGGIGRPARIVGGHRL
jgi:hypothetical protein